MMSSFVGSCGEIRVCFGMRKTGIHPADGPRKRLRSAFDFSFGAGGPSRTMGRTVVPPIHPYEARMRVSRARKDPDVTTLLRRASAGEPGAWDDAFRILYDELREVAGRHLGREQAGHTLQPTALVNEAYIRLVRNPPSQASDRHHFVALAARAMRQVLVDHARAHSAAKRGGGARALTLQESLRMDTASPDEVLALDLALDRLNDVDPRLRQVVELRYFGGMKNPEVAQLLDVSERTVRTYWTRARAWLHRELGPTDAGTDGS